MFLLAACLISAFTKNKPIECFSFHISCALWWLFHAYQSQKRTIKGDDGLRIIALPINDATRAVYAVSRICAFPMLPHVYAVVPFTLSVWMGLPSAESSNVALFMCSYFYALSFCFDKYAKFAIPLVGTTLSLLGHAELSHRIDARTKWWVVCGHSSSAVAAFLYCNEFDIEGLFGGLCTGVLYSSACIQAATQLRNTKNDVSRACKVGAVASLLTLPARFYSETNAEDKVAAAAELILIMSSIWFYTFEAEWHTGKAKVCGSRIGYAVAVLGIIHLILHQIFFV